MSELKPGDRVIHVSDPSLGVGVVKLVDRVAGSLSIFVQWAADTNLTSYTEAQLSPVPDLPGLLEQVGPGLATPFQLRLLGRWFEARHEKTGEITNQPFDMLPHQVVVTHRVIASPPAPDGGRHWLIADDVGLGKTIEAGMILEVMRHRAGGSLRCLIVAPAGLTEQWRVELTERFGRVFEHFDPKNINKLETFDQMIASIDTLKLKGNKEALLQASSWDLVIFDEAHHLTKPGVQSYDLARDLRERKKAKNTLLLTATPHSGNHEHFSNMLHLLRPDLITKPSRKKVEPTDVALDQMIIRNRKHVVTDSKGERIFHGIGDTKIFSITPSEAEIEFASKVKDYLKYGYEEGEKLGKQARSAVGFLMTTFGKLMSSSREALKSALERRSKVLAGALDDDEGHESPWDEDATASMGLGLTKGSNTKSWIRGEKDKVDALIKKLNTLPGPDSKLHGFLEGLKKLAKEEPSVKILIFTEYRATQDVVVRAIEEEFGTSSVAMIHGSMKHDDRKRVVKDFNERESPRFLVSTAAGGEGLNMQYRCFTIVNYDMPWNPNVLQQRIGRVYRYGQKHPVIVFNLKVETDSDAYTDNRVYQYLERKLNDVVEILKAATNEKPEDLIGDVLGQAAQVGLSLEQLHKQGVEQGEKKVEATINEKAKHLQEILSNREMTELFARLPRFNLEDYKRVESRVTNEQLAFFVRQYCEHQRLGYRDEIKDRFSFSASDHLVQLIDAKRKSDPYAVTGTLAAEKISNATVVREEGQKGARLLRFGDPVFEAMVRHVQFRDFSSVASLDFPSASLDWEPSTQGVWMLFELQVARTEGKKALILRRELASFVVPEGATEAREICELIERVIEAVPGPPRPRSDEARRAFELGRAAASDRLSSLRKEVVAEYPIGEELIQPVPITEFALAWIRAT